MKHFSINIVPMSFALLLNDAFQYFNIKIFSISLDWDLTERCLFKIDYNKGHFFDSYLYVHILFIRVIKKRW